MSKTFTAQDAGLTLDHDRARLLEVAMLYADTEKPQRRLALELLKQAAISYGRSQRLISTKRGR